MEIERVVLNNFLSYQSLDAEFHSGLNVIEGKNAVGKTNLVDAMYLGAVGRSAKGLKDKELINWNTKDADKAYVKIFIKKEFSHHTVETTFSKQGKLIAIDGLPIAKLGEIMGVLNVVFFSPDEMKLIKESPEYRRRFLDISLSQQSKKYFYALIKYNKYLAQRNKVLKDMVDEKSKIDMVQVLNPYLAEYSAIIASMRYEFVEKLSEFASEKHAFLTDGAEKLAVSYLGDFGKEGASKENYLDLLNETISKDIRLEFTSVGVHRDDLKIASNGVDLRKFGSQGQQRTSVLSLKLAETELFKAETGEYPVLLLDDVLSELDLKRKKALFSTIDKVQTFITCTSFDKRYAKEYTRYVVKDGKIKETK